MLIGVICFSGYKVWEISAQYLHEAQVKDELVQFRPQTQESVDSLIGTVVAPDAIVVYDPTVPEPVKYGNQSIIDLQNNVNEDVVAWLTIPNTNIDYPIVAGADNVYYLDKDIHKNKAKAGTIFVDYRCAPNFTGFNTVVYGHNMKNRSMFGDLREFADSSFFEENQRGFLFLADDTYVLEFFAYMVIRANDPVIYAPLPVPDKFIQYARDEAMNFREPRDGVNVLTLSTCAYNYNGARMVLLANMVPLSAFDRG